MPNDFEMAAPIATAKIKEQLNGNYRDALQIARYLHDTHFAHVPEWEPLPTLSGVLSQISNMVTAWRPSTPTTGAGARPVHPFGPCGYKYCDWPDGELRCNEPRHCPPTEAAQVVVEAEKPQYDLDPLEFWQDLAEALGHPRPTKADVPALVSEVAELRTRYATVRANAIRECVNEARAVADTFAPLGIARKAVDEMIARMESLTKKEGEGRTA
jgi:hypothetical protein